MSSHGMVFLQEGVDVDVPADLEEMIGILDQEIPWFSCDGYGYCLSSAKGTLGERWEVLIKLADPSTGEVMPSTLGRILMERANPGTVRLRVPPRSEEEPSESPEFDSDGRLFGSFVSQILNTCQRYDLIELPGALPTV